MAEVQVIPTIIMPNRDFLVGVLYGFNVAKKLNAEQNAEKYEAEILNNQKDDQLYFGYWLELTCAKCKRMYCYDNPNDLPVTDLICETENCGNHLIVYGIADAKQWRLANMTFV